MLAVDLKTIHQRIKDNVDVLCNFSAKREEGKERAEYISLLKKDLCTYYSYNYFLIEKLLDLFPLSEVGELFLFFHIWNHINNPGMFFFLNCKNSIKCSPCACLQLVDFLEANEIHRPVTIRTNTLKTRRRDLAQVTVGRVCFEHFLEANFMDEFPFCRFVKNISSGKMTDFLTGLFQTMIDYYHNCRWFMKFSYLIRTPLVFWKNFLG